MVAVAGCGPQIGMDEGRLSGQGSAGTGGEAPNGSESSGLDPADDDDEGSSGVEDEACPATDPNVAFTLAVEFPGNELPAEGGELERNASCVVAGSMGGSGRATLDLVCDEEGGQRAVDYRVTIENEDDPFSSWLDGEEEVDLQYERWSGFETGSGQSLALAQDGFVHLVAHTEGAGGGLVGVCADSQGTARIAAEEWLWKFDARISERRCAEGSLFRLGVTTRDGDASAFPGTRGVLEDVSYVYPEAQCSFMEGGSEDWHFSALLWR